MSLSSNRRGLLRWSTKPKVVAAEPGREFAFVVELIGIHREMTTWRYRFEPAADSGTDVTEFFELVNERDRDVARQFYKKYIDVKGMPVAGLFA